VTGHLLLLKASLHLDGYLSAVNCPTVNLRSVFPNLTTHAISNIAFQCLRAYHGKTFPWFSKIERPEKFISVPPSESNPEGVVRNKDYTIMDEVRDAHLELNKVLSDEPSQDGPNLIMDLNEVRERFPELPSLSIEDRRFINLCDSNVVRVRLRSKLKGSNDSLPSHPRYKALVIQSHALSFFERNILHGVFGPLFENRRFDKLGLSRTVLTLLSKFKRCHAVLHKLLRSQDVFYGLASLPESYSQSLDEWGNGLSQAPDSGLTTTVETVVSESAISRIVEDRNKSDVMPHRRTTSREISLLNADLVPGEFIREMILSGKDATKATLQYIIQRGVPPELGSLVTMEMGFAPSPVDSTTLDLPRIDYDSATTVAHRLTYRSIVNRMKESPGMTWPEAEFEELFELVSQFRDLDKAERRKIMFLYMREATDRCKLLGYPGLKRPAHRSARDASLLIT